MKSIFSTVSVVAVIVLTMNSAAMAQTASPSPSPSAAAEVTKTEAVTAPTAPIVKKWTCTAEGLAEFSYDGSGWARIRLSAYATGGNYRVTKDETGDIAKGVTQDRTPFVCTNK